MIDMYVAYKYEIYDKFTSVTPYSNELYHLSLDFDLSDLE